MIVLRFGWMVHAARGAGAYRVPKAGPLDSYSLQECKRLPKQRTC